MRCNTNEVDKNTFGNSKCAIDLADILTKLNNKGITRKTGNMLQSFNNGLNDLQNLKHYQRTFMEIWLTRYKNFLSEGNFPKDVETRILNLMVGRNREVINKLDE